MNAGTRTIGLYHGDRVTVGRGEILIRESSA